MFKSIFNPTLLKEFCKGLSSNFNLDEDEVKQYVFNYCIGDGERSKKNPIVAPIFTPQKKVEVEHHTCSHCYRMGKRKGEICGKKATVNIGELWYCGTKKVDEEGNVTYTGHARTAYNNLKTSLSKVSSSSKNDKKSTMEVSRIEKDKQSRELIQKVMNIKNIILQKNKYGNYVHFPSSIIIDEKTERVIGSEGNDGDILKVLTEEQKRICILNGWIIDESVDQDENVIDLNEYDQEEKKEEEKEEEKEEKDEEIVIEEDIVDENNLV